MTPEELVRRIAALVDEYNRDIARRLSVALAGEAEPPLPQRHRAAQVRSAVVALSRAGMRPRDIAKRLGRTQNTVNTLLNKARKLGEIPPAAKTPATVPAPAPAPPSTESADGT